MKENKVSQKELKKNFLNPPDIFGEMPCYWWDAGKLNKEKIKIQLKDMREKGVSGAVLFNQHFPGDKFSSVPAYFTEEWWEFIEFIVDEGKKLGLEFWFSAWEGRGYWQKKIIEEYKEKSKLFGSRLILKKAQVNNNSNNNLLKIDLSGSEKVIDAAAYKVNGSLIDYVSRIDLNMPVRDLQIEWMAPNEEWVLTVIVSQPYYPGYLDKETAKRWIEVYWNSLKEKFPEDIGKTIKGSMQDEVFILNGNILFTELLLDRVKGEKNFDISAYLIGLFYDIGNITDKVRCSYYDVMTTLLEENLYSVLHKWHQENNMIWSTDATWGRLDILAQTYHYGDFFRMMRNFDITGNEDPRYAEFSGERRFVDTKFSSSVAHIYKKKRVIVDFGWQSGWGVTQEQNLAWANENYAYGANLYNRHCVLYSLMAGWYEWVPPAVYFYQPYWNHWKVFSDYIKRLSYMLSQGHHAADAALLYPLDTIIAGMSNGKTFNKTADFSAKTTVELARLIYQYNIDFDFVDDTSIEKAKILDGKLIVEDIEFKVLILPPLTTIRTKTLKKIKEFYNSGGMVIAFNMLPGASVENGRDDPNIAGLINDIFGIYSSTNYQAENNLVTVNGDIYAVMEERADLTTKKNMNKNNGKAFFVPGSEVLIPEIIKREIDTDFTPLKGMDIYHADQNKPAHPVTIGSIEKKQIGVFHTHQKVGDIDIYFLFNSNDKEKNLELIFNLEGIPKICDCFGGKIKNIYRYEILEGKTKVRLKMAMFEGAVIIFSKDDDSPQILEDNIDLIDSLEPFKNELKVKGYFSKGGRKKILARYKGEEYVSEVRVDDSLTSIKLENNWDFSLKPTMHNKWGDFRYPPSEEYIGAEARRFRYMQEDNEEGVKTGWHKNNYNHSSWPAYTYTFGPYFWSMSFTKDGEPSDFIKDIEKNRLSYKKTYKSKGVSYKWEAYDFSLDFGNADKLVHNKSNAYSSQGLEGISENFIVFEDTNSNTDKINYLYTYLLSPKKMDVIVDFGAEDIETGSFHRSQQKSGFARNIRLNGKEILNTYEGETAPLVKAHLNKGINTIILRLVQKNGQRIWTYIDISDSKKDNSEKNPLIPRLKWFKELKEFTMDITPDEQKIGWYSFEAPAGTREIHLDMEAKEILCHINGRKVNFTKGKVTIDKPSDKVSSIVLKVTHRPGFYAGAAMRAPVRFVTAKTKMPLGNWEDYALESYSGGVLYENSFNLDKSHIEGKVILDLGKVMVTAEVRVNGKSAGIKIARPYSFDITGLVKEGKNKIEVLVYNTLANHYNIGFPSQFVYENQTISGLMGPVKIEFLSAINMSLIPSCGKEHEYIKKSIIPRELEGI